MEKSSARDAESSSETASASAPISSPTNAESRTLSVVAIRARKTPTAGDLLTLRRRRSAVSSSALLSNFARGLFFEKTPQSFGQMLLGLGGDLDPNWNDWITLSAPSDSGRVALALTSGETGCSCLPNTRAPNARDWKGMSARSWRERAVGDKTPTLPDQIGGVPHPEFVEQLLGFPAGWTDLDHSEMPSSRPPQNGSEGE